MERKQEEIQSGVSAEENGSSTFKDYTPIETYSGESVQLKLDGTAGPHFEKIWGKTRGEALEDVEWILERIEEGWSVDDFCSKLNIEQNKFILKLTRKAKKEEEPGIRQGVLCQT